MTERDPLSPSALASDPAVEKKFIQYRNVLYGTHSWQMGLDAAGDELVSAIRDATLKAERDRLLALTPDEVVEAAAKAMRNFVFGSDPLPWERLSPTIKEHYREDVRAALPVLLAPEVAKREAAEREVGRMEQWVAQEKEHIATAEAEVARLRGALGKFGNAPCLGTDENNDTCGVTFTCGACRQNAEVRAALEAK